MQGPGVGTKQKLVIQKTTKCIKRNNLKIREMFNMRSESRVANDIVRHSSDTKPSDRKYRLVPLTSARFLSVAVSWNNIQ